MNCPHCGAHIDGTPDACPLCGINIDKEELYNGFIKKGDGAFNAADYDKAMVWYQKALDLNYPPSMEIYIKYGNAHDKKNDRQAAGMYLKALSFDFYNERVHTLLISFYDKHNRLNDLKKWYEKSTAAADAEFIRKQTKIIDNIITFRQEAPPLSALSDEARQKKFERMIGGAGAWFKNYIMMNIVFGITIVLMGLGIAAGLILKLNMAIIFACIGCFFLASIIVVVYMKQKKIREMKKNRVKIEDIYREFKK